MMRPILKDMWSQEVILPALMERRVPTMPSALRSALLIVRVKMEKSARSMMIVLTLCESWQCENGTACTIDADCTAACQITYTCENGLSCEDDADCVSKCTTRSECQDGTSCTTDAECATACQMTYTCEDNTPCTTNSDCVTACENVYRCTKGDHAICTSNDDCNHNSQDRCQLVADESDCPNYTTCTKLANDPCPSYTTCEVVEDDCPTDKTCTWNEINPCPTTTACLEVNECPTDKLCHSNSPCGEDWTCSPPDIDPGEVSCIDNKYEVCVGSECTVKSYMGYFDKTSWYEYNTTNEQFEIYDLAGATEVPDYSNAYVRIFLEPGTTTVARFQALGNYFNWATSSKFDIEKKILTGGKYDSSVLESEGRGCSGNSYIKEVSIGSVYFRIGVRTDYDYDDTIDTTLIDVYPISTNPVVPPDDPSWACQEALGSDSTLGDSHKIASECFGHTTRNAVENQILQECWSLRTGKANPDNIHDLAAKCLSDVYSETHGANGSLGTDPRDVTPDKPYYVCYGDGTTNALEGFVGECFDPLTDADDDDPQAEEKTVAELAAMGYASMDDCLKGARERFCNYMNMIDVVDPTVSNSAYTSGWSPLILPTLGKPTGPYKVKVAVNSDPEGLLHTYSTKINVGAMAFNNYGSISECADMGYDCGTLTNKDGAYLVQGIGYNQTPALVRQYQRYQSNEHLDSSCRRDV